MVDCVYLLESTAVVEEKEIQSGFCRREGEGSDTEESDKLGIGLKSIRLGSFTVMRLIFIFSGHQQL